MCDPGLSALFVGLIVSILILDFLERRAIRRRLYAMDAYRYDVERLNRRVALLEARGNGAASYGSGHVGRNVDGMARHNGGNAVRDDSHGDA
jgi:hypothetical protein